MNKFEKDKLRRNYAELVEKRCGWDSLFGMILQPLFEHDGYKITHADWWGCPENLPDVPISYMEDCGFIARRNDERVCVEFKGDLPWPELTVSQLSVPPFIHSYLEHVNLVIVAVGRECTRREREKAEKINSQIRIIDFSQVMDWIESIEISTDDAEFHMILSLLTDRLARLIARKPSELWSLEWRDLERVLATVFEGLGFEVELTPSARDGGKDIVLDCFVRGRTASYIVEVKHWRSKKVGSSIVEKFLNVVIREQRDGGLLLASSGFSGRCKESLVKIQKYRLMLGGDEKIVSLCRAYVREDSRVWNHDSSQTDLLFEDTE